MILIADSGSTKTDWRLILNKEESLAYKTQGFNPFFNSSEFIKNEIERVLVPELYKKMNKRDFLLNDKIKLFYYGAGCSSDQKKDVVYKSLRSLFPLMKIEVDHDLLGAARALCGEEAGIAAILGTGSNSCLFDGKQIIDHIPSLGYILGDEGSGAHIGKVLLGALMHKEMPVILKDKFHQKYSFTEKDLLTNIYNEPMPNRFLASFSEFVSDNIDEPYLSEIVFNCFDAFFKAHITKYKNYTKKPFNCVGSVGYLYSDILTKVAAKYKMEVGKIIKSPMEELIKFHSKELS